MQVEPTLLSVDIIPIDTTALDTNPPTPERQSELHNAYESNVANGLPPYWHVHIHTCGELVAIMQERGWLGTIDDYTYANMAARGEYTEAADLREVNLSHANLTGIQLIRANLTEAILIGTNLTNAELVDANLSHIRLRFANLTGANLQNANLTNAHCRGANFTDAKLTFATLYGARFSITNLCGTRLIGAHMDASTVLSDSTIDNRTQFGDIIWNDALLTRINWDKIRRIGDEDFHIKPGDHPDNVPQTLRNAARAYRGLAGTLQSQGMNVSASRFRLREQQLEQRAARLEGKPFTWFGSLILEVVAGYGERPGKTMIAYLVVVITFTLLYFGAGQWAGPPISPLGSLIFSITSFHGRGFFPATLTSIDGPIPLLAAFEAVFGLFIELIFIATFSRRFLGGS